MRDQCWGAKAISVYTAYHGSRELEEIAHDLNADSLESIKVPEKEDPETYFDLNNPECSVSCPKLKTCLMIAREGINAAKSTQKQPTPQVYVNISLPESVLRFLKDNQEGDNDPTLP